MAGTKQGAELAKKTNLERHGDNFFRDIGRRGGRVRVSTKGFGSNRERAREAGKVGGARSRRGKGSTPFNGHKTWYFTFGQGQLNEGKFITIEGTYAEARDEMLRRYGKLWASQYSPNQWYDGRGVSLQRKYNLTEIK